MKKHQYFKEVTFDKLYTSLKRSRRLDWNAKALITHIINLQEKTKKSTGKNLVCFQPNSKLSKELGIPPSTLNKLITRLGKLQPKFFTANAIPSETESGYFNRTEKLIDMSQLLKFLSEENHEESVNSISGSSHQLFEGKAESSANARNELKNKISKEQAFSQLTDVLSTIPNFCSMTNDEVMLELRFKVMGHSGYSDQEKIICSEWVEDFIREDLDQIRSFMAKSISDSDILTREM